MINKKVVWLMTETENGGHSTAIIFWYGILEKLGYEVVYYPYEEYQPDKFYSEMRDYKPHFIIHPCYANLHLELTRLRDICKVYVLQSDDDWRFDGYAKFYIPFVDGTISYQAERSLYLQNGAKEHQVISAKWAFNPNTMMSDIETNKDILLSHAGGIYGDRSSAIEGFNNRGIQVSAISNVDYPYVLNLWSRSKYSLCFTKSSQGNYRQKKGRLAEIPYYSVLVSERFPNMENYYEPNKEFVLFDTVDEACEKIKYYEKNPQEYNKILEAGRSRLWNTNTVFHQWNEIMSIIDEDYKKRDVNDILKKYN